MKTSTEHINSSARKQIIISIIVSISFVATFSAFIINLMSDAKKMELVSQSELLANIIYEVKTFDSIYSKEDFNGDSRKATLYQIRNAFASMAHELQGSEFLIAKKTKTHIEFIAYSNKKPKDVLLYKQNIAVPMRLALNGEAGLIMANDYRGKQVYAAYRPIDSEWGLVIKQDKYQYLQQIFILVSVFLILAIIMTIVSVRLITRRQKDLDDKNARLLATVESLTNAAKQANIIAQGNYDIKINVKNSDDILGIALKNMTKTLKENKIKNQRQAWISDGLVGLNNSISDKFNILDISKSSLEYICNYLGAGVGAIYIYEDDVLKMYASYAYIEREHLSNRFKLGEGTVGQVGLQRSAILLKNIKRSQSSITTGTTSEAPLNTYTFPLIYQDELQGVIELASHELFNDASQELLNSVNKVIATSFVTARQNTKVEELLKESQDTNAQMQEQQAQLEEANAQMEEQQQQLEQSREILLEQNRSIEQKSKELQIKADELEVSGKYRSEFLANMSHELRTPLNAIILLSSLMQKNRKANLNEDDIKKLLTIHESGNELLKLINDILDLSKIEAGKMNLVIESFQSQHFLEHQKRLFEHLADEKNLKLNIIDDYRGAIVSDFGRMGQIIKNLLSNSFKFTKEGFVTLRISKSNDKKRAIKISVKDSGIGIAKEKQELIFQAFAQADGTTSREFGGTGLGLSISKELASLLGGNIILNSKESEGSEFIVTLPNLTNSRDDDVQTEQNRENSSFADDRDIIGLQNKAFLIIDDDENFAKTLYEEIKLIGAYALIALNGKEALALARKHSLQGILLDLTLPDIDGIELLKKFKEDSHTKNIPIYIVSGKDKDNIGLKLGAIGYAQKPLHDADVQNILNAINETHEKSIKKLLIIEDNKTHAKALKELIGDDINTISVDNSSDAIELIENSSFGAIVVDLGLSDGNGLEVCEYAKATHPNIPIIIYTGRDLSEDEKNKLKKLSDAIVLKTAHSDERILSEIELFLHKNLKEQKIEKKSGSTIDLAGLHILAVDDDIKNIYVLTSALDELGAKVSAAYNGKEAIEQLKEDESIDIVLMDIMMPVMDGYEAIDEIRKDKIISNIPIIALTAKAMKEDKKKCLDAGADDYLSKPIDLDALSRLIKAWSQKRHR